MAFQPIAYQADQGLKEKAKKRLRLASLAAQALAQHQHAMKGGAAGGKPVFGPTTRTTMATPGPLPGKPPIDARPPGGFGVEAAMGAPVIRATPAGGQHGDVYADDKQRYRDFKRMGAFDPDQAVHDENVDQLYGEGGVERRQARAEWAKKRGLNPDSRTWTAAQKNAARKAGLFSGTPTTGSGRQAAAQATLGSARQAALAALLREDQQHGEEQFVPGKVRRRKRLPGRPLIGRAGGGGGG